MNNLRQEQDPYSLESMRPGMISLRLERAVLRLVLAGFAAVLLLEAWLLVRALFF